MKKIIQVSAVDLSMNVLLGELNRISVKSGYEVIGVCSEGNRKKEIEKDGVRLINVNIDRKINPVRNLKTILELKKVFKSEKPDIVHVHTPIAAVLGRIASKLAKVPITIYTAHGFYFHENMKPLVYKIFVCIEKYIGRYFTDFIFTQSEEDAKFAIDKKFLPKDKILAIGNGVDVFGKFNSNNIDTEEILKLRKELGISEDEIVISFIGRMVREKGILDLLEGFNLLECKKVKLLVIGDIVQGDRDLECAEKVKEFSGNKNIIFTGKRSDINNLLYISDVFCLPSYREGMPRSIIEAMAMDNAIVATNIRGSREEVLDKETGFLIPLMAPIDIKEKLEILIKDKELLKNMKVKGRKRAEELYDEKKVVKRQLDIFKKLLNDKGI